MVTYTKAYEYWDVFDKIYLLTLLYVDINTKLCEHKMKYLDTFWRKDLDFNRKKDLTTSYFKKTLKSSTEKSFFLH